MPPSVRVVFDARKPELGNAFAIVIREDPTLLDQPDALRAVREKLADVAPAMTITVIGVGEWQLDGEVPDLGPTWVSGGARRAYNPDEPAPTTHGHIHDPNISSGGD